MANSQELKTNNMTRRWREFQPRKVYHPRMIDVEEADPATRSLSKKVRKKKQEQLHERNNHRLSYMKLAYFRCAASTLCPGYEETHPVQWKASTSSRSLSSDLSQRKKCSVKEEDIIAGDIVYNVEGKRCRLNKLRTCAVCNTKYLPRQSKCSLCLDVWYCSKKCQRSHRNEGGHQKYHHPDSICISVVGTKNN